METQLRIERYADQGRCVAHMDGRVVFVRFALPDEVVRVRIDEPSRLKRGFCTGEVTDVIVASPYRSDPIWPLAGPVAWGGGVGGADLIHVSLPGQLDWKSNLISQQMERLGRIRLEVPITGPDQIQGGNGLHWRTRIDLVADDQGRPSMRRRGSHDRVPLDTMPLATSRLLNQATRLGLWDGGYPPGSHIRMAVPEPVPGQPDDQNLSLMVNGVVRQGSAILQEYVCPMRGLPDHTGFHYQVKADGFWQVHRMAPPILTGAVLEQVEKHLDGVSEPVIWDLYSGAGLFTLPLAAATGPHARILAIEGSAEAVDMAKDNIRHAGMTGVRVMRGDVAAVLKRGLPRSLSHPDLVLLDPPRAGAKAQVCKILAGADPKTIIYVACDPTSLARDTATLTSLGYILDGIRAFDIYPMTHHVETVAVFTRQVAPGLESSDHAALSLGRSTGADHSSHIQYP